MEVNLRKELVRAIGKKVLMKKFDIREDHFRWSDDVSLDLRRMSIKKANQLYEMLEEHKGLYGTKTNMKEIETWLEVRSGRQPRIVKLKLLEPALIQYLLPSERRWLYKKSDTDDDQWLAYRVTKIEFHAEQKSRDYSHPAYVTVKMMYDKFGVEHTQSIEYYDDDVLRRTVPEILANEGYYTESTDLRNDYLMNLEKYENIIRKIGTQFILKGIAINTTPDDNDEQGRTRYVKEKIRDVVENKCVIDIFTESEEEDMDYDRHSSGRSRNRYEHGAYFWEAEEDEEQRKRRKKVEERVEDPVIEIPVHQFAIIFDLQRHQRMSAHVSTLTEYKYDKSIGEKLILPPKIKGLIDILIEHKSGTFIDIVRGKSGGAIVALTGKAGVGKTLTAEVYAESTEKPLYNVQASQLGIDPNKLESNLKLILRRASRWGAILLLDEADVYVAERGRDLNQNAIVGIFLRVLEYHTSMMFLTSNRPESIDDAILSRCVARIDYEYPSVGDQIKIWGVLSKNANIKLSAKVIKQFVDKHNSCSGRDVKNLLKLANLKALSEKKSITIEHIESVLQFNPTLVQREKQK